jgi:UDP-N-acetylmuramoylalanine--D-glutamate ligase
MSHRGRHALVLGAARTGRAVCRVLVARGARVRLADRRGAKELADAIATLGDVELRLGEDGPALLAGIDLVVPSPGVAATAPLLAAAVARGVEVTSEIEIAAGLLHCPLIAITGTNGKSTTTTLVGDILRAAGRRPFVGGNLGTPLIEAVDGPYDVAVAEVSSFQLEWVRTFRPAIAVLLNVTADHLDRHGSMAAYIAAKARIFAAQGPEDAAVLNRDDEAVWALAPGLRGRVISIGGCAADVAEGAFAHDDGHGRAIVYRDRSGSEQAFPLANVGLVGDHNVENMMAAVAVGRLCGIGAGEIQRALEGATPLPHRCEFVGELGGVRYYDDSKATNVGAVVKSLAGFAGPVVLLAGGLDKGTPFDGLRPAVAARVRSVVAYGVAAERIAGDLAGAAPVVRITGFAEAFRAAAAAALPGDTVLLSPGCASFDQFADYAERGRTFRELVRGRMVSGGDTSAGERA